MTEIWRLDATAQAELVQRGEVTAAELTALAIDRIESLNPAINAVVHKLYASAAARASTALEGPFAGVPMLVKDASLQIEGTPYTIGTTVLRDAGYRSDHTTELARRFLSAGFVIAGKTNVPEMSAGVTTEPAAFGATRNPWDLARSPGGSSGGSAAAVACGMTPIAHGGDGTGSLRYPASMCGVVTLKPTRGLVPSSTPTGLPEDGVGIWSEFVLARSVRDLAGVFDAVVDPGGTSSARAAIQHDAVRELRVGLLQSHVMLDAIEIDDDCARAVARAGELLATLGHHVEEEHPPALDGMFARIGGAVVRTGIAYRHAHYRRLCEMAGRELTMDDLSAEHIVSDEQRAQISDVDLANAAVTLAHESAELLRWWDDHDVLVTPVLVKPPWPLGTPAEFQDVGGFPSPFSFSGQPAMSVPLHWTADGLPVGVQLVGAPGRDGELLRLARQIEEAAPWAHRWPPISSPGTRPLEPGT